MSKAWQSAVVSETVVVRAGYMTKALPTEERDVGLVMPLAPRRVPRPSPIEAADSNLGELEGDGPAVLALVAEVR